ncbi:MAG TPA: Do family serine endopeptidase [Acidiphilium sp.]|nr:MAG: endopeptidase [Acidiphilium sp. 21-60-14]OYV92495.1 MAG: endopeptidase [Acidiphilium sp. 37-60-79]OZB40948.1 MAG: endopeptidase [Acidiphilium sp. 34-60-192]HQT87924.1 Do family serine endopeptidase [Acidiphilium sp.]HQU22696.1 Do family serine endopeptidase [Acidiphilium sp.]
MTTPTAPHRSIRLRALTLALLGGTALGLAGFVSARADGADLSATAAVQKDFKPINSFAPLVRDVKPAVVSVTVHLKVQRAADHPGQGPGPGMMPFPFPFPQPQQPQAVEAKGSGFFISSTGYLVTNNHVVRHAKSIFVTLSDGEKLPATLVGHDKRTDLAVLKVTRAKPFPYLEFGNSAKVVPGQWVVAIGNPFGLAETATAGIVSALGRDIGDGEYDSFIQIDAPINEGNSGGPLLNQRGQVIGVNTAILSPTGGSVGIGFSIPSDMVKTITAELIKNGHITRGFIGVSVQPITQEMAQAMGVKTKDGVAPGALIAAVEPRSPADRAGIKPGDIVTDVDGHKVDSPRTLALAISTIKPGDRAHVTYLRNGAVQHTSVAVEKMPANLSMATIGGAAPSPGHASKPELGLTIAPLTQNDRHQLDLPLATKGAVITNVAPDSPADEAGLRSGDLIVGVGSVETTNPNDVVSAIQKAEHDHAKAIALRVMRGNQSLFVAVPLPAAKK